MRRGLLLAGLLTCAAASWVLAGPVPGPMTREQRVPARSGPEDAPKPGVVHLLAEFRGGQRACVIAAGDHKPVVPMSIAIYEKDSKRLVGGTEFVGAEDAPDVVAAIWYPPRDGAYIIQITSDGEEYNDVVVTLK